MIKVDPIIFYLVAITLTASIFDFLALKIPNWLTYPSLAVGISYFTITKGGYEGFIFSLAGAAAGFGLLILPYMIGGTGAGDVKLMGAVGSFLGAHGVFMVFIFSGILGGAYAIFLLASKGLLLSTLKRYGRILWGFIVTQKLIYIPPTIKEKSLKIRFGVVIAMGTVSYLVFGLLNIK
jgi:prepilin peptidase CpaA